VTGRRCRSAAEALADLAPGATVVATPGSATPETILRELGRRAMEVGDVGLEAGLLLGSFPFADAVRERRMTYRSWHVWGAGRAMARGGLVDYVPLRASDVPGYLATRAFDVALVRVAPPDREGWCNLGPSATYTRSALAAARRVIAEVDPALPRTCGDTDLHVDEIDRLVDADTPTCLYPPDKITTAGRAVAARVVPLVPRDAVLQIGIGAVPAAVLAALAEHDVGTPRFVGMATDSMAHLIGARPSTGAITAVELMGSTALFEYADRNPGVQMVSSDAGHAVLGLSREDRFVSINSAMCVDLSGQVASDQMGELPLAGIGGSVDFAEAGRLSSGGVRIIALAAIDRTGHSTIRRRLPQGTPVTLPRHSVDVVVTEYGTARLTGASLRERAARLAAIAAPQFRSELCVASG
jgi:4-hydroxybutyrate CoA-transferase